MQAPGLRTEQEFHDMDWAISGARRQTTPSSRVCYSTRDPTARGRRLRDVSEGWTAPSSARVASWAWAPKGSCAPAPPSEADASKPRASEPYLGKFIGVGLDSSELGHNREKFRQVATAGKLGRHRVAQAAKKVTA